MTKFDTQSIFLGVRRFLPFLPSVAIFGLIFGFTGSLSNLPLLLISLMSFIIFAGSAQFFTLLLIIEGKGEIALIAAAIFINIRHLLYGATLFNDIKSKGLKRYIIAYFLTDEAFLVTMIVKKELKDNFSETSEIDLENVLLGSGIFLWLIWNSCTIIGYWLKPFIEQFLILSPDFIIASTFLGYLIIEWNRTPSERKFISTLILVSFLLSFYLQSTLLLIIILIIGIIYSMFEKYLDIQYQERSRRILKTINIKDY